ncbi:preprotein translocase subunit YajC [Candidatus Calescamantes bacterium]|nr:preprotein translocase subunit YajC [Candidatus Calescamantes bacterium]
MNLAYGMAQGGTTGGGGGIVSLLPLVFIFFIFYFLLILPQRKKEKEHQRMLQSLQKGDKVVTTGGIYGTVVNIKDKSVVLKVDDNTRIEFTKSSISGKIK